MADLRTIEWSDDLLAEILGDRRYDFSYVQEESLELVVEILRLNVRGIAEEYQDACYAVQMWLYPLLGLNLPVVHAKSSIRKFRKRIWVWKCIFDEVGVDFHLDYLKGGSNFARPAKVQAVLKEAGIKVSASQAEEISKAAMAC